MLEKRLKYKAAICEKGHIKNYSLKIEETYEENYCSICGGKIIDCCFFCKEPIKGDNISIGAVMYLINKNIPYEFQKPYYCPKCGKPFPWTENFLKNCKEIIDTDNQELNEKIYKTINHFLNDKFSKDSIYLPLLKQQLNKIPKPSKELVIQVLLQILSSTASAGIIGFLRK